MKRKVDFHLKNGKSKFALDTDDNDIKLPALITFVGARGTGKTYSCVALVRHYETKEYVTRTFLMSPTTESNDIFENLKTLNKEKDVYEDPSMFSMSLADIKDKIKTDWDEYERSVEYRRVYKKWQHNEYSLTIQEEMLMERMNYEEPKNIPRPSHVLIIDDAQGTNVYTNSSTNAMTHLAIKHRHVPVTICFLVQSWTGLPRTLRLNSTQFVLFKTADKKQLFQMYESFGNLTDWDTFEKMFTYCTDSKNGFLFIDTDPKEEKYRFRKGFDELLIVNKKGDESDEEEKSKHAISSKKRQTSGTPLFIGKEESVDTSTEIRSTEKHGWFKRR